MSTLDRDMAVRFIAQAAHRIVEHESELSRLDAIAGDGDHGTNMAAALGAARRRLDDRPPTSPAEVFHLTSQAFLEKVGGAAGGLFGAFFQAVAARMDSESCADVDLLVQAWQAGLERVMKVGRTQPGGKTMVDALVPALQSAQSARDEGADLAGVIAAAAQAARQGAEETAHMPATAGRARYAPDRGVGHPDPGAVTVAILLEAWSEVARSRVAS